ncbi:MAG: DUF2851 family protein [Bacteroidetes bacterium]|nr:DUF2851 family protein [Bacteroidota bacterium]
MTEEFLHYLWKYKLLKGELMLTNGDKLEIIHQGMHNTDAGPDFFNARLKIADTIWAGNVEIHVKSSDWFLHRHQHDKAYDTIILHVVYQHDADIERDTNMNFPVLIVKDKFDEALFSRYQDFISNKNWIPCEKTFRFADKFIVDSWLERLLIERIERKTIEIKTNLAANNNNWEECFYQILAKNFGFKLNALPFEFLAKSLPSTILAKHKNSDFQIAALLFGQAGLLSDDFVAYYPQSLHNEYEFLRKKYQLKPISAHLWKFLRLRPSNFPTIRLSQFADLIYQSKHLFQKIIEAEKIDDIYRFFQLKAAPYFDVHYTFDDEISAIKPKHMGKATIDLLIINTVIPTLFLYAKEKDESGFQSKALSFLEQMKAENNAVINKWISISNTVENAFQSQALLELKNNYCTGKKCLQCRIGNALLKLEN